MNVLTQWRLAVGDALRRLVGDPLATVLNLLALGCALGLALAATVWMGGASRGEALGGIPALAPQVTVYLKPGIASSRVEAISRTIAAEDAVTRVRVQSGEEALASLVRSLGDERLLEGLDDNPLPDALVVDLAAETPAAASESLIKRWRGLSGVGEVMTDRDFGQRVRQVSGALRRLAQSLILLLLASSAVIVFNTIRLQLAGRRGEIELIRLLGASAAFVRRPFVAHGALLGAAGGAAGWGMASLAVAMVATWLAPLSAGWGLPLPPSSVGWPAGPACVLAGALIGGATAWLTVGRHIARIDRG